MANLFRFVFSWYNMSCGDDTMTKIMIMPTRNNLENIKDYADALLLGFKDMSVNTPDTFTLNEIKEIKNKYNKEIFVAINKNMYTKDLDALKEILLELDKLNLNGIFYYDISLVQYMKELDLKTPLVWSQEHLTTNYLTMNYWYSNNIKYTYVSSEITLEEIEDIAKNTKMNLIVPIFGHLPMFVSKRNLVNNYKEYFNINDESKNYELEKECRRYPIDNNNLGTVVYSSSILNGLSEFKKLEELNISYVTLNSYRIPNEKFIEVAKLFWDREYDNSKIDEMFPNVDKGFLYKETIYRVKRGDK